MIKLLSIASGSKGNATLIYDNETVLLFDMGVTLSSLKEGLSKIDKNIDDLAAIFITHEHSDHIKGLRYLKDKAIYASPNTLKDSLVQEVGSSIQIGYFNITSFSTSHDASNPVGYIIDNKGTRLVYITDTGYLKKSLIKQLSNADYYLLESNHDVRMLEWSGRPRYLISRIRSRHGHLSNEESALNAINLIGEKTKAIYLAHKSEDCNSKEAILETYKKVFEEYGLVLSSIKLVILYQYIMTFGGDI